MSNCNQLIPDELLYMIVDHVHDRHTLYTLLTANKAIFHAAVKRLWKDPFGHKFSTKKHFLQLYTYVLVISPCRHPDVENLRQNIRPGPPPYSQPYVDYLALIHHVNVQGIPKGVTLQTPLLPFMVCNGRFEQLATIVTAPTNMSELVDAIPAMTQLSKIYCVMGGRVDTMGPELAKIHRFVVKFVAEHGDRGRQLQIEFMNCGVSEPLVYLFSLVPQVEEIYRLLGPFPRSKRVLNSSYDLLRYVVHQDHVDVSCIREIDVCDTNEGLKIVLPWCFALEKLHVADMIDCRLLFKLFSNASQPGNDGPLRAPGPKSVPMPRTLALQSVCLVILLHDFSALVSELVAYCSMTMEEIELNLRNPVSSGHVDVCVETTDWRFPKLQKLALHGDMTIHYLVRGDLSGMSKLEVIDLNSSWSFNDCNNLELFEPWNLPELRSLEVSEVAGTQFRIESLARSPKLENLDLFSLTKSGTAPLYSVTQPYWLDGISHWSSVHLPLLERVSLCNMVASCIDLPTIVRCMPGLNQLSLFVDEGQGDKVADLTLGEFVFGKGGNPAAGNHELSGSLATPMHCHSNLTDLRLEGVKSINVEDYCSLVKADRFPRLKILSIYCPVTDDEFRETFITAARRHPTLEIVHLNPPVDHDPQMDSPTVGVGLLANCGPDMMCFSFGSWRRYLARLR